MKTTKEKVLEKYPGLTERVVYRLAPVGRKGHCALVGFLQIWDGANLIAEEKKTKRAYQVAKSRLDRC